MDDRSNAPSDSRGDAPRGAAHTVREESDLPQRDAGGRDRPGRISPREASGSTINGRSRSRDQEG